MRPNRRAKASPARAPLSRRLALAAAATALALGLAELWFRRAFAKDVAALRYAESDLYYYYDRAGVRRHIPGKTGYERLWNDQGKAAFRINALGLRGREVSLEKPAGERRVLFLGDSITLGGRLPEEDIFVERVARALAARKSARYETINAGMGDIGLQEEEGLLKRPGLELKPDLVVLCWYLNDARPPVGFPEETVFRDPWLGWFHRRTWLQKSYLAGFLYDARRKSLVRRNLPTAQSRRFDWVGAYNAAAWAADPDAYAELVRLARFDWGDAWDDDSMARMEEGIRRLRDLAAKNGARFALVALPEHAQVYAKFRSEFLDRPQLRLGRFAREAGIPFLDLLPPLRRQNGRRLFYDNCHYTPEGNGVVAEEILRFLDGEGLLKA